MSKMISACGIDCEPCECRLATLSGDMIQKADIAARWSVTYQSEIKPEDINCVGCTQEGIHFAWCGKCPIRACAIGKGYETCAQCELFPCQKSQFIIANVPDARANIESLKTC